MHFAKGVRFAASVVGGGVDAKSAMAPKQRPVQTSTLDGFLRPGTQSVASGLIARKDGCVDLAAHLVLATAKTCGCDTRVGAVAFGSREGRLLLHLDRLQAAAVVWKCGPPSHELKKACADFLRLRMDGDALSVARLSEQDLEQLASASQVSVRAASGSAIVEGLKRASSSLASPHFPVWGRPVALEDPWVAALPTIRSALGMADVADCTCHVACGSRSTWQPLRSLEALAADGKRCGTAVEALEVDLSWRDGVAVERPPFVLRP